MINTLVSMVNEKRRKKTHPPDIQAMFVRLNGEHFGGVIPNVPVVWNNRMTTTSGKCRYKGQPPKCYEIALSNKLFRHLSYDHSKIKKTLIHEMVHAFLVLKYGEKGRGHTPRFHKMMTDITGKDKNHRCHNYDTSDLERKLPKNVLWRCYGRCGAVGYRARMPLSGRRYSCQTCSGEIEFYGPVVGIPKNK